MNIQKKKNWELGGGRGLGRVWGGGGGGQGGCERRIEVFVKIQKKFGGVRGGREGSGWGVRVDVIEELKFLENSQKKIQGGGGLGGWGGSGWVGGQGGCE